jgi:hypothetical protein
LVVAAESSLAANIGRHLGNRAEVRGCTDTLAADAILRDGSVDLLICRDTLPAETGIMFLARHVGDTPSMRRILLCPPLEPALLLHVINEARVFRCVIEPCPAHELYRHVDHALAEAVQSRAQLLAYIRSERPANVVNNWIRMLPRIALLAVLTCGGVLALGIATLLLLYLLKSFFGIDLISDAHLSGLWE